MESQTVNEITNGHGDYLSSTKDIRFITSNQRAEEMKQLEGLVGNVMMARSELFRQIFDPRRDIDDECGYPRSQTGSGAGAINSELFKTLYEREAIAARVVQVLPKESWQVQPLVYEDEDTENITEFEEAWDALGKDLRGGDGSYYLEEEGSPIWEHLRRADIQSGIGHFGILLIGIDDGLDLGEPADGVVTLESPTVQRSFINNAEYKSYRKHYAQRSIPTQPVNKLPVYEYAKEDTHVKSNGGLPVLVNYREMTSDEIKQEDALTGNRVSSTPGDSGVARDFNTVSGAGLSGPNDGRGSTTTPLGTDAQYIGVQLGPSEFISTEPSSEKHKLIYLRSFDESLVQVVQYEANVRNPRFGQPVMYRVTLNDPREQHSGIGLPMATVRVHWSRVIHLADNLGSSEIFGVPRMRPVLNRLLDLRKLYSGSAEMYWRGAFPGLSLETNPQMGGDVNVDVTATKTMMENYMNSLQRYLVLIGMSAKTLAPTVVDPTPQINTQLEAICIQLGIPKRVFCGSERGELASSQDDASWNDRLRERQNNYITPRIIVPFIDRLIAMGVLPAPKTGKKAMDEASDQAVGQGLADKAASAQGSGQPNQGGASGQGIGGGKGGNPFGQKSETKEGGAGVGAAPFGKKPNTPPSFSRNASGFLARDKPEDGPDDPAVTSPDTKEGNTGAFDTGPNVDGQKPQDESKVKAAIGYSIEWPDLDSQTAAEKADVAVKKTQALTTYISGGGEAMVPPHDFMVHFLDMDEEEAADIIEGAAAAHENEDTMTTPPMIGGRVMAAPPGTQDHEDASMKADQFKMQADSQQQQMDLADQEMKLKGKMVDKGMNPIPQSPTMAGGGPPQGQGQFGQAKPGLPEKPGQSFGGGKGPNEAIGKKAIAPQIQGRGKPVGNVELEGGRWVTTEGGHHIYIKDGEAVVGNPHVLEKVNHGVNIGDFEKGMDYRRAVYEAVKKSILDQGMNTYKSRIDAGYKAEDYHKNFLSEAGQDALFHLDPDGQAQTEWREAHDIKDSPKGHLSAKEVLAYQKSASEHSLPNKFFREGKQALEKMSAQDQTLIGQYIYKDKKPEGEIAEAMNRAVAASPPLPQDVTSHRGLRLPEDKVKQLLGDLRKDGEHYLDLGGPRSFSDNDKVALDFAKAGGHRASMGDTGVQLSVLVPAGTKAAYVFSGLNMGREHILSNEQKIRIVKAESKGTGKNARTILYGVVEKAGKDANILKTNMLSDYSRGLASNEFNPDQARADDGKWTSGGGMGAAAGSHDTGGHGEDKHSGHSEHEHPVGSFLGHPGHIGADIGHLAHSHLLGEMGGITHGAGSAMAAMKLLGGRVGATAAMVEHVAKSYVSDKIGQAVSKLPDSMQKAVNGVWAVAKMGSKVAFASYTAANAFSERVAKERGLNDEQARRLRGTLAHADIALAKPTALTLGAAASFVPMASTGYLAYSTARSPVATLRAAKGVIKDAVTSVRSKAAGVQGRFASVNAETLSGRFATNMLTETENQTIADALHEHEYSDWYMALLAGALDGVQNVEEAVEVANEAFEKHPTDPGEEGEATGELDTETEVSDEDAE